MTSGPSRAHARLSCSRCWNAHATGSEKEMKRQDALFLSDLGVLASWRLGVLLSPGLGRRHLQVPFASINLTGSIDSIVFHLLEPVRKPARHPRNGEDRREQ